jgi:hypothetical protein
MRGISKNETENYGHVKSSAGLMLKTTMLYDLVSSTENNKYVLYVFSPFPFFGIMMFLLNINQKDCSVLLIQY